MDRAELKKHIHFARDGAVQVAFAIGRDGEAVLQMHRRKPGRALEKELKEGSPDSKNHRWGTLQMDRDDPKLARFVVNKAVSGMSRKLSKALKGTGCSKVQVVLEDGTEVDVHEDEDGEVEVDVKPAGGRAYEEPGEGRGGRPPPGSKLPAADEDDEEPDERTAAQQSDPDEDGPAAPRMQAPAGKDGQLDVMALTQALTGLVKRMMDALRQNPSQKAALTELATDAQASLKRRDLEAAAAGIEVFRMALDDVAGGAVAGAGDGAGRPVIGMPDPAKHGGTPKDAPHQAGHAPPPLHAAPPAHPMQPAHPSPPTQPAGNHGATHPAAPVIAKSRMAWTATRQRIEAEIAKLAKQFEAAFTDHESADELVASFRARVDSVLHHLDEALSHKLDEVNKAHDAAQRAKLVEEAHALIVRYSQHIASDPTIKELDENPFVPMAVAKMLTATLSALSKSIH